MNKILFTIISVILFFSCAKKDNLYDENTQTRITSYEAFENYVVPIKEGYTTCVTYGEDTLALTNSPITIKIPKRNVATRSNNELKVDFNILNTYATYSEYWQAVMFEDSKSGDYDYNDLIIHVRNKCEYPHGKDLSIQTISIQPIALGGYKTIGLGCILADKSEHIISNDVRKDLFNNKEGYINTTNENLPIRYKFEQRLVVTHPTKNICPSIAWFIEVDGNRFYAISSELDYQNYNMVDDNTMPYGIVEYSTFTYPKECSSIFDTYPGFRAWFENGANNIGKPQTELCYKYSYGNIICADGVSRKIWDYQDLK